jgi:RNA polymerase sigma-70 factor (ECF subfamily)
MWVTAARDGDRAAFGQLYERYARMVHGVLLSKVQVGDVDDLVQDVFIRALRRLSTLRETASFGAWLAAIARNVANDYDRRSVPEESLTDDAADHGIHCGVSDRDQDRPAAAILDAVMSLSETYRETLILRLVEGMTGPEIAARTGMTHGSVRVDLHRGMEQLRVKLSAGRGRPELVLRSARRSGLRQMSAIRTSGRHTETALKLPSLPGTVNSIRFCSYAQNCRSTLLLARKRGNKSHNI